jgi:acyl-homoserine lactone synthase
MGIEVIEPADRLARPHLLTSAFALRHRGFVEDRGWEVIRQADGLDIDRHDLGPAIHFVALDQGRVVGHVRLVPGEYQMVAARADPALVRNAVGNGEVYTLSRFCVDGKEDARKPIAFDLLGTAIDYAEEHSVGALLLGTDSALVFALRMVGLPLEPVGAPVEMVGRTHQAVLLRLDSPALVAVRKSLAAWTLRSDQQPVLGSVGVAAVPEVDRAQAITESSPSLP